MRRHCRRFGSASVVGVLVGVAVSFFVAAPVAAQTVSQNAYRYYVNIDGVGPSDPWPSGATDVAENTPLTRDDGPPTDTDVLRIRMTVQVADSGLSSGQTFKLQYGVGSTCSAIGTWTDVGGIGSGVIWRGYDNALPTDGATITTTLLTPSDVGETYEEANSSASTPNSIAVGEDGEWDWVVQNNGAADGTTYCFRMIYGDDSVLDAYLDYPKLTTKGYYPKSQNWQWYRDMTETPADHLTVENTQGLGILNTYPVKLRLTAKETSSIAGSNIKLRLQYDTSTSFSAATNIPEAPCTDAMLWCYYDGPNDADEDNVSTKVLTDSDAVAKHNESGTAVSTYTHAAGAAAEWEFTIQAGANISSDVVYYFRAYDKTNDVAVPINTGETYPSMETGNIELAHTVSGVTLGTTTEGVTTDVTSTATSIPFGTLAPNAAVEAAQQLSVTTDAFWGYSVYVTSANRDFLNNAGDQIQFHSGSNASPTAWGFDLESQAGAFGYHSSDASLGTGDVDRFSSDDTWAGLVSDRREIIHSHRPSATAEVFDIVFKVEGSALLSKGNYSIDALEYIVAPNF
jgi:hypothetical protein